MTTLTRFSSFVPTKFDRHIPVPGRDDWYVAPVVVTRDSPCIERNNFNIQRTRLIGCDEDTYEVHRFGHWACGWFDIMLVKPGTLAAAKALDIAMALDVYPSLDDNTLTDMEYDDARDAWDGGDVMRAMKDHGAHGHSLAACRRPDDADALFILDYWMDHGADYEVVAEGSGAFFNFKTLSRELIAWALLWLRWSDRDNNASRFWLDRLEAP